MSPPIHDVTAGRRAREIREHPGTPQVIVDPTDSRFGEIPGVRERGAPRTEDPIDPLYGEVAPRPRSAT